MTKLPSNFFFKVIGRSPAKGGGGWPNPTSPGQMILTALGLDVRDLAELGFGCQQGDILKNIFFYLRLLGDWIWCPMPPLQELSPLGKKIFLINNYFSKINFKIKDNFIIF